MGDELFFAFGALLAAKVNKNAIHGRWRRRHPSIT
jgi:hypothetical protein